MLKRTEAECRKCKFHVRFTTEVGMTFAICKFGDYNSFKGYYKVMDGCVNCPQGVIQSLQK